MAIKYVGAAVLLAGAFLGNMQHKAEGAAYAAMAAKPSRHITIQRPAQDVTALFGDYAAKPCSAQGKAYIRRIQELNSDKVILYGCGIDVLKGARSIPAGTYLVPDMRE